MGLTVLAVSDVHSPRYLFNYIEALTRHVDDCNNSPLFLWAGDMVDKGNVAALSSVVAYTRKKCSNTQIVSIFGNDEYMDLEGEFKKKYNDIIWLNDSYRIFSFREARVAIYGTRGVLDRPTRWQRRNIPLIYKLYSQRLAKLKDQLKKIRDLADIVIVAMHYAPTFSVMRGEDAKAWPEMGSRRVEEVIREAEPDIVIYGHLHNAEILDYRIGSTRLFNVSLPARRDITVIEL